MVPVMFLSFDNSYARLPGGFFAPAEPTPVNQPELIAFNRRFALALGLDLETLDEDKLLLYLSGNAVPPGAEPIALAYAGHQFGGFSPQLGDGRAILLGEVIDSQGIRRDVQLKGSGPTPFSRRGDGRSALGPVLREYLLSESMAALGIPTTRALAAVWSGDQVVREQIEPGGVFTRVASSHLRIGTFEYFAARRDLENLKILLRYAIDRHYPELSEAPNPALAFLESVCRRQAQLIAQWLGLGFIHGVMNTDNMSVSGETIDYGPCAFLDRYDPEKTFSYIDRQGRYAYANQPLMAHWNLTRLAEALLPCMDGPSNEAISAAEKILATFPAECHAVREEIFSGKLGFNEGSADRLALADDLLNLLHRFGVDFTIAFRQLARAANSETWTDFTLLFGEGKKEIDSWLEKWRSALREAGTSETVAGELMKTRNPAIIPRNHRVEEVIQAGRNRDFAPFHRLLEALQEPYADRPEQAIYEKAPDSNEEVTVTFCGT